MSGCWTQIGHNAGNTRYNDLERVLTRDNVASLSVDWSVAADPPGGGGGNLSEPVVFGGRVYTTNVRSGVGGGGDRPVVQSYDLRSGRLAWEQPLPPDEASDEVQLRVGGAQPAVLVDDVLWVPYWLEGPAARCSGRLVGLDRATGEVLAAEETDRIESPLVADGSIVAYTARTGCEAPTQLVVRDRDSMETRWTYPVPSRTPFAATPTIAHGKIFVVFGGVVYAFDADGCSRDESEKQVCDPEWTREGAFRDRPVAGPGGQVLAVRESFGDEGTNQSVQALDSETGDLRWQTVGAYGEEGIAGIAVADNTVYVAGTKGGGPVDPNDPDVGTLDAYGPAALCSSLVCNPTWRVGLGEDTPSTAPVVAGGVVYAGIPAAGTRSPGVVAADADGCGAQTCRELVRVPLDESAFTSGDRPYQLSVARGRVFVAWQFNAFLPVTKLTLLAPAEQD